MELEERELQALDRETRRLLYALAMRAAMTASLGFPLPSGR